MLMSISTDLRRKVEDNAAYAIPEPNKLLTKGRQAVVIMGVNNIMMSGALRKIQLLGANLGGVSKLQNMSQLLVHYAIV